MFSLSNIFFHILLDLERYNAPFKATNQASILSWTQMPLSWRSASVPILRIYWEYATIPKSENGPFL